MYFGEQLNNTNGEIIYVDFSTTSMQIAQRRAIARNLRNIVWVKNWIEGSRYLGLGSFENVQCSGVLHHLKNPTVGLNVLKDLSLLNGGMGLMVYAQYGRTAVYMLQYLLRLTNENTSSMQKQLLQANVTLNSLPSHHWFVINPLISDHKYGNIGM